MDKRIASGINTGFAPSEIAKMQAMPDSRQQSFEEIYGPPENFLEIEVSFPLRVQMRPFASFDYPSCHKEHPLNPHSRSRTLELMAWDATCTQIMR